MTTWAARLDVETTPTDDTVETLHAALTDHSPAVGTTPDGQLTLRLALDADTARAAADTATHLTTRALAALSLDEAPILTLEITRWDRFEAALTTPTIPTLWGLAEIADHLEVSRSRAGQLAADRQDFPRRVQQTRSGPLFIADQVTAWAAHWERRRGRPPRTATS